MLIKIDLLTTISKKDITTTYFFDKANKIVLSRDWLQQKNEDVSMALHILNSLRAEILCFEINEDNDGFIHVITKDKDFTKITASIKNVIKLSTYTKIPIFIEHETLFKDGIMVTKELIEDTLRH